MAHKCRQKKSFRIFSSVVNDTGFPSFLRRRLLVPGGSADRLVAGLYDRRGDDVSLDEVERIVI